MKMKKKTAAKTAKKAVATKKPAAKPAPKPVAAKKAATKPAAAPSSAPAVAEARKRPGTYTPPIVQGSGWAPFRYPPQ